MKKIIIILSVILLPFVNFAQNPQTLIDSARVYYTKGDYQKAVDAYKKVLDQGLESSELYYNLGNSYYKLKQAPYAILNYERAKKLDPNNKDINFNLKLAQRFVVDKIDVIPEIFFVKWAKEFVNLYSSDAWAVSSMVSFAIFIAFLLLFLFINSVFVKKFSFYITILFFIISIFAFVFSNIQKKKLLNHNEAIVFSPTVTVKSSPDQSGNELFLIHEGLKVTVTDSLGNWREIQLSDGNKGWLEASDIVKI